MGNEKNKSPYTKERIRKLRTFPTGKLILLVCLITVQVLLAVLIFVIPTPAPQDTINEYTVTVTPRTDGSLDIEYRIVWTPLDPSEPLTWVDVGAANPVFSIYKNSLSGTIRSAVRNEYDGYVSVQIDLNRPYAAGETLTFSFRINQQAILSESDTGYFHYFIPGWFNEIPVEHYEFRWLDSDAITVTNADAKRNGYYVWEGSLECGDFVPLKVEYDSTAFPSVNSVHFDDIDMSGAYNALEEERFSIIMLLIFGIALLLIIEIILIDAFVSYHRGRGLLTGYGYHIHTYGRPNPHYQKEAARRSASSGRGGHSGGGCACACACACAGGGRAGCSQKDTVDTRKHIK